MYLHGGYLPLGHYLLSSSHRLPASTLTGANQMLDLSQSVSGTVAHARLFLYFGLSDPPLHCKRPVGKLCRQTHLEYCLGADTVGDRAMAGVSHAQ